MISIGSATEFKHKNDDLHDFTIFVDNPTNPTVSRL